MEIDETLLRDQIAKELYDNYWAQEGFRWTKEYDQGVKDSWIDYAKEIIENSRK